MLTADGSSWHARWRGGCSRWASHGTLSEYDPPARVAAVVVWSVAIAPPSHAATPGVKTAAAGSLLALGGGDTSSSTSVEVAAS